MRVFVLIVLTFILAYAAGAAMAADSSQVEQLPPSKIATAVPSGDGPAYTSVIIDASGLGVDRCMSPKIRRADGTEVWGTVKVDLDFVSDTGIVGYVSSMEDARKCSRCGSNPMIIRAIDKAGGKFNSDPVISDPDAELLIEENKKGKFLDDFKVIIVKDGRL